MRMKLTFVSLVMLFFAANSFAQDSLSHLTVFPGVLDYFKNIKRLIIDLRRYDGLPWEWNGVPPDICKGKKIMLSY
jgi:hypothetical protein